jgi:NAD-dependent deacetylase
MKKLVVLSGAGMSAESGISTFRDSDGLWENHRVEDVASPSAWQRNPELVLDFYNQRRKQLFEVQPNEGHKILAELENNFDVQIITQNVDDLHERAGSSNVLHLHGELKKVRSTKNPNLIYEMKQPILNFGDLCEEGSQLRPHIVWFGEEVPMIPIAAELCAEADILLVVGTSLNVYPAAGLIDFAPQDCKKYLVNPKVLESHYYSQFEVIQENAVAGLKKLNEILNS